MVAEHPGVAVTGAALLVAVDLRDRGVEVDHETLGARPRAPGAAKKLAHGGIELAHLPEAEPAQPVADGRGRPRAKAEPPRSPRPAAGRRRRSSRRPPASRTRPRAPWRPRRRRSPDPRAARRGRRSAPSPRGDRTACPAAPARRRPPGARRRRRPRSRRDRPAGPAHVSPLWCLLSRVETGALLHAFPLLGSAFYGCLRTARDPLPDGSRFRRRRHPEPGWRVASQMRCGGLENRLPIMHRYEGSNPSHSAVARDAGW